MVLFDGPNNTGVIDVKMNGSYWLYVLIMSVTCFRVNPHTICRIVGPSLAASLEPLAYCRNVASLSLFYRCYFGRCSSELAQLVPLPYSQERSTHYSDRLHHFSVTIPRCYKDVSMSTVSFLAQLNSGVLCL